MPIVTLSTDFGVRDAYVGSLKGVILGIAPDARVVDITHDVEPHDILHGAFVLRQVWPWYPPGTIHLAIVDPGVGSARRILLGKYAGRFIVVPDNGLITFVHRDFPAEAMHVVENRRYFLPEVSHTFHGRDIMAPVAAHLARGVNPREFGRVTDRLETLAVETRAARVGDALQGVILYVDRFGTLVTNVRQDQLSGPGDSAKRCDVLVNGRSIGPIRSAYSDVAAGEPLAIIGSAGYLEIALNRGRADQHFGRAPDIRVAIR